ncbi:MAG: HAD-IIIC family phosphatase [Selenomonadaceae bacterium]|nr:HAD-IIIC family phosphatase [Selenomonadaceae bacterium]
MFDITKVKLVIWDLDETFWAGTITSEIPVTPIEKNFSTLRKLTDAGIINSICSKNDFQPVKEKLIAWDIWDLFVFPSIDWTPKGERIKSMLDDMGLRAENVLFVDDNSSNLGEAKFYLPEIMTLDAKNLDELYSAADSLKISDAKHERLNRYKILEKKQSEKKSAASNEEFLQSANIQLAISHDCRKNLERIAELVARTNQLNFTKRRDSKSDLEKLVEDDRYNCALIFVRDKFGDYGAVGFYCLDTVENRLQHFLFSCRVLGMGVEQFIYAKLNFPQITTVGEVASQLNSYPPPFGLRRFLLKNIFRKQVTPKKLLCKMHREF